MAIRETGTPLKELQRRLSLIRKGVARSVLTKNLAVEARTQIMNEFRESRDPYGNAWKKVVRGGQPLLKSGRGRASFRGEPTARGFRVVTNVFYMVVQNYGARIKPRVAKYLRFKVGNRWVSKKEVTIPQRQIVPERRLGNVWARAFIRVTNAVLKDILERGGHGVR